MVDWYGVWTYEPNTPEEKKCALDRIADYFVAKGFKPETTIENCVEQAVNCCCKELSDLESAEEMIDDIEMCGGLREYDWWNN